MSEYIIKVNENDETWHYVERQYTHFFGYPITEEIVRCRDCIRYSLDDYGNTWCAYVASAVQSDDFCAWGERKVVSE